MTLGPPRVRGFAALTLGVALAGCAEPRLPPPRVVVAVPSGPTTLVPDRINEEFAAMVTENVFERLVTLDAGIELQPELAEAWYNESDTVWVFGLRGGVTFHDGSALRAADVVAAIENAWQDPESRRGAALSVLEAVDAPDPQTVRVRTRTPVAALPRLMGEVMVWKAADGPGGVTGTGPYRVVDWEPGRRTVLESFGAHWRGAPEIASVEYRVVPSADERLAALAAGEAHLVLDLPGDVVERVRASPRTRVVSEDGIRVIFLGMDVAKGDNPHVSTPENPFRDRRVREAISLAVDRSALVQEALSGYGIVIGQLAPPGAFGHHPELPPLPHDPEAARRLLAEAGFADGFEVALDYMPDKFRGMRAVVQALAAQLAAVGVRVTPRPQGTEEFFGRLGRRDTAFYLWGWLGNSGDAGITYDYLLRTSEGVLGIANATGYSSPEVDRLLEEASRTLQPDERRALLWSVAETARRDLPLLPLYRQVDLYGIARELDFRPRADRRVAAVDMRWHEPGIAPGAREAHP